MQRNTPYNPNARKVKSTITPMQIVGFAALSFGIIAAQHYFLQNAALTLWLSLGGGAVGGVCILFARGARRTADGVLSLLDIFKGIKRW